MAVTHFVLFVGQVCTTCHTLFPIVQPTLIFSRQNFTTHTLYGVFIFFVRGPFNLNVIEYILSIHPREETAVMRRIDNAFIIVYFCIFSEITSPCTYIAALFRWGTDSVGERTFPWPKIRVEMCGAIYLSYIDLCTGPAAGSKLLKCRVKRTIN